MSRPACLEVQTSDFDALMQFFLLVALLNFAFATDWGRWYEFARRQLRRRRMRRIRFQRALAQLSPSPAPVSGDASPAPEQGTNRNRERGW